MEEKTVNIIKDNLTSTLRQRREKRLKQYIKVRSVTLDEWNSKVAQRRKKHGAIGKSICEESQAIREMQAGEVISYPCRWTHKTQKYASGKKPTACGGMSLAYQNGRGTNKIFQAFCEDEMVYVRRAV